MIHICIALNHISGKFQGVVRDGHTHNRDISRVNFLTDLYIQVHFDFSHHLMLNDVLQGILFTESPHYFLKFSYMCFVVIGEI